MKFFFIDSGLFYYKEVLNALSWLPTIWHPEQGFGTSSLIRLWYDYPIQICIKFFSTVGFSWWVIDKLLWILPTIIGVFSSWKLARYVSLSKIYAAIASIIYITNTYFLLIFGGGQLGVALGYGIAPYVLLRFIKRIDSTTSSVKSGLQTGVWLALLVAFDLRLAYLTLGAVILYFLLHAKNLYKIIPVFIIPGIVATLLHIFWILPVVLGAGGESGLGGEYTSPGMLNFLSVADFSHAISLLHPNWPENLFGKVYFLQPEFLILPLLAFSALLFLKTEKKFHILFFPLLTLIGSFFAKGVNDPIGGIFQWMFIHIPGFIMFRDPTKFYLYVAIGYSVLIPFVLERINKRIIVLIFICYWIFTIRALFAGQVTGNFKPLLLSTEYVRLKNELVNDSVPSRTLWIPRTDYFAFSSTLHPVLTSDELFHNASVSGLIGIINSTEFEKTIRENGIGYVVVPEDTEKRIFLSNYKFDSSLRENLIDALNKSSFRIVFADNNLIVYKSEHDPLIIRTPSNINRQQYLANIGTVISGLSLIFISFALLLKRI
jgi:hypothetical protein